MKWAVKLGKLHRPSSLPTEGGMFHRKVTQGRAFGSLGKEPSAGRLRPATPSSQNVRARSALCQRYRDEARRTATAKPDENAVLVVGTRGVDRLANLTGTGHVLSRNFENHVAFLEATLRGRALGVDLGHHHALLAGAGNGAGGRK